MTNVIIDVEVGIGHPYWCSSSGHLIDALTQAGNDVRRSFHAINEALKVNGLIKNSDVCKCRKQKWITFTTPYQCLSAVHLLLLVHHG